MITQTIAWYFTEPWSELSQKMLILLSLALMIQPLTMYLQQLS